MKRNEQVATIQKKILKERVNISLDPRLKDIAKIPYHEIMAQDSDKNTVSLGDMIMTFTGGFDFWGFTMPGGKTDPVLIYPSLYHGKEENNYHSYANMTKYNFARRRN